MKFILIFLITVSTYAKVNLQFKEIKFLDNNLEISGITKDQNGNLLFVSDNTEDQYIYKLIEKDTKSYSSTPLINFSDLNGFFLYYYSSLIGYHAGRWIKSPWDLEGMYRCGNDIYLVNEQVRHVLKIDTNTNNLEFINLNFQKAFEDIGTPLEKISNNAGFEGIALNCEEEILYIAQERDPRAIIIFNLKNKSYEGIIKTELESKTQISPDYSDLYYENNFLYVLERNEWNILKIDLTTKKVVERYSFEENNILNLKKVYKTNKPYGLAEALFIDKKSIILGIDNNNMPLTKRAEILFNFKGNFSSIIVFERPKGF